MGRRKQARQGRRVVALSPGDTLMRALALMDRARTRLLPVVCAGGVLVGLVSETHLLEAWKDGPLDPVALVMTPVVPLFEDEESPLLPTG